MIDVQAMPFWVLLLFSCLCFSNSLTISFHQRPRIGLWLQVASSSTDDSSPARRRRDNDDDYSTPQKPNKKAPTSRSVAAMALMESNEENQIFPIRKLESDPNYLGLPVRDKAYARMILSIVERRRGQIDKVLKNFMQKSTRFRKNRSPDMLCQAALRIGAAQLLFLETPSYAVIKETVDVLRKSPTIKVQENRIKFVNAVLRNIDREGNDTLKETSFLDNIEPWLVEEWKSAYGDARAQIIAESAMDRSPIYLTTKSLPGSKLDNSPIMKAFQTSFTEEEYVEVLPQGSIRIPDSYGGDIASWPLYDDGEWWIQDPSATIPAMALYHGFVSDGFKLSDLHVLDLCSAPGGKTMQLGSYGFNHVTAVELSQRRAKQLKSNLNRVKMQDHCTVIVADGSRFRSDDGKLFDGILVDAPCSATGLGSRRPDVLRRSCDINELTSIQRKLAVHAFDNLLKPGGIMVYATCSLLKEESEDQMKWLLDSRAENIKSLPFTNREIPGFDGAIDENGWMRVLPGVLHKPMDKCDGFFVARIRKKS